MAEQIVVEVGGGMMPLPRLFPDVDQWVFDPQYEHGQPSGEMAAGLHCSTLPAQAMERQIAESSVGLILAKNLLCDYTFSGFGDTTGQILKAVKRALAPDGAFVVIDDDYCGGLDTERMLNKGMPSQSRTELAGLSFSSLPVLDIPGVIIDTSDLSRLQVLLGVHSGFEDQPVPLWERLRAMPRITAENQVAMRPPRRLPRLHSRLLS